ncbi:transcriptional regulator, AraC family [Rhizobiales bacterium GAS188]|nr:transcriptional regulator, AraC family [Rhizobiales bacterium GAS188]
MGMAAAHMSFGAGSSFAPMARELFGRLSLRFHDEEARRASLVSAALGPCRLSRIEASAHGVTADRVARQSYDVDAIKLVLQMEGRTTFEQGGHAAIMGPRTWIMYDPTRPYVLNNTTSVSQLLLQVPRTQFSPTQLGHLSRPYLFDGEWEGMPRIIAGLMRAAIDDAARLDEPARTRLGDTLTRLATSLIVAGEDGLARHLPSLGLLRERIKAYVETHLCRPDLDVEQIAERVGCSRRYVFRAFEADDSTPERFIWELRLARAAERLRRPELRNRSISEISFSCGFSSSAHFSRAFRRRFGRSPRDYRVEEGFSAAR